MQGSSSYGQGLQEETCEIGWEQETETMLKVWCRSVGDESSVTQ